MERGEREEECEGVVGGEGERGAVGGYDGAGEAASEDGVSPERSESLPSTKPSLF